MNGTLLVLLFVGSLVTLVGVLVLLDQASRNRTRDDRDAKSLPAEVLLPQAALPITLYFEASSARIGSQDRVRLNGWAQESGDGAITIEAGADASGNPGTNRRLVRERAQAAAAVLVASGVDRGRIHVVLLDPEAAPTEALRRPLRRVTLRLDRP